MPDSTDQARALLDDLLLSNDGLSGQEQIIVAALSAAREAADREGYQRGLRRAADLARFMARCEDGTFSDLAEALEREAESR